ncbi:class I SAM-dependent methyltransferase [Patescibacteria group bacterium]|nr:class I SAM-dependent methyltransferase [Patescibacteria group bacterium]
MNRQQALKIIEKNRESYNKIAKDFDVSRKYEWPEFELLKPHIKEGDKILDIGCGNARLYKYLCGELNSQHYVGVDISANLIKIAKKTKCGELDSPHKVEFGVVEKVWELPFEEGEFDSAAGIAFLHHIPSEELRLRVLREIHRVLAPGGILFLTNWNLWQWNRIKKYKLRLRDFFFKHNELDAGDFWIKFQGAERYYHHFTKGELTGLCKKAGFSVISCKKEMNMVIILRKQ